ncbi:MAG: ribonuclease HIII [Victivallaceae bacterium]|nr:ribonuclease HIII [Victivallaceae bacterium]
MAGKVTSHVAVLSGEQISELRMLLDERGWAFAELPYGHWKASKDKTVVAAYCSGKLVIQGAGTADFVSFILEPEILHEFSFTYGADGTPSASAPAAPDPEELRPHGGIDESGKGDFFGPLVIAGVCTDEASAPKLRAIGVCDSKLIKSSARIVELAGKIRDIVDGRYSVVRLMPPTYNRLYAGFGNLNRLLAWGHARTIENLLEKAPECPRMLSDQFAHESLIRRALMERGRRITMEQKTKGESDVAVAAASILARDGFLRGMKELADEYGVEFPRGAGPQVRAAAETLLAARGRESFGGCAKLHFKTLSEIV